MGERSRAADIARRYGSTGGGAWQRGRGNGRPGGEQAPAPSDLREKKGELNISKGERKTFGLSDMNAWNVCVSIGEREADVVGMCRNLVFVCVERSGARGKESEE